MCMKSSIGDMLVSERWPGPGTGKTLEHRGEVQKFGGHLACCFVWGTGRKNVVRDPGAKLFGGQDIVN